jgi:hypothetical protein
VVREVSFRSEKLKAAAVILTQGWMGWRSGAASDVEERVPGSRAASEVKPRLEVVASQGSVFEAESRGGASFQV